MATYAVDTSQSLTLACLLSNQMLQCRLCFVPMFSSVLEWGPLLA